MKKIVLTVFLLFLFFGNTNGDSFKEIKNEYWSWDSGNHGSFAFESYFFSADGTFRYSWGYKKDKNFGGWYSGTYLYDIDRNKIIFNTEKSGSISPSTKKDKPAPRELAINEMDESFVIIDVNAEHEKARHHLFNGTMERKFGRIKEQKWIFMHYTTVREFYFDSQGNCFYKEGKQGAEPDFQYECEYAFIGDTLFLLVKSSSVMKMSTKKHENIKYDTPLKTYVRIGKADNSEIQVENVTFGSIIGGGRTWSYSSKGYSIKNRLPAVRQKDYYKYKIEIQNMQGEDNEDKEVAIY